MKFPVLWLSFVSVWAGIAGPHQLNSCQNLNLLKQINNKQTSRKGVYLFYNPPNNLSRRTHVDRSCIFCGFFFFVCLFVFFFVSRTDK